MNIYHDQNLLTVNGDAQVEQLQWGPTGLRASGSDGCCSGVARPFEHKIKTSRREGDLGSQHFDQSR